MVNNIIEKVKYQLCIVIPCYNESSFFLHSNYQTFLQNNKKTLICFVNDGSTDNTIECITSLQNEFSDNVKIINHRENKGKAAAVKTGFNYCNETFNFENIAYLDADLAVSLEECYSLNSTINKDIDFVFGSRVLRIGSTITRNNFRHYTGRVIATLISYILSIKVYDTQCGCKIFKKELAKQVFIEPFISKWLFDVEIFFRILNYYGKELALKKMHEVPLERWIDRGDSKVKITYFFKLWFDLFKIKNKYSSKVNKTSSFSFQNVSWVSVSAFIIATITFHICYGLKTVVPTNINWLLSAYHDWGQHYLGWAYFREAPWTFPLGDMNNYFYPLGTNVGFTDSIPLFALLLKPISSSLPSDFQYLGFFMYSAFILGAIYTLKIFHLFKINKIIALVGVVFIITSPLFIFRGMHPALTAHWLILASIYYYLVPTNKENAIKNNWKQVLIFFLSTTIHPYLAAMVFGFCVIIPLKNYLFENSISIKSLFIFPLTSLVLGLLFWYNLGLIGFDNGTGASTASSYGENTFNLNSFFNSYTYYSNFFSGLPRISDGQHEGFSYLGLGMMIISFSSLIYFLGNLLKNNFFKKYYFLIPIFSLVIGLLLFSISHIVTFGNSVLFEVPIPEFVIKLGSIFRGCGRFCWPFYYLFTLFSIILFSKLPVKKTFKISIFVLLLGVQLYDIEHILTSKNLSYGSFDTKLKDEKWIKIFSEFDEVITYPPYQNTMLYENDYQDLMFLASKAKTPITTGYVARSKPTHLYLEELNKSILKDRFNKEVKSLFVTTSNFLNTFDIPLFEGKITLKKLDNFIFIYSSSKNLEKIFKETKHKMSFQDSIYSVLKNNIDLKTNKFIKRNKLDLNNKNEVKFGLDELTVGDNTLKIRGWAFNLPAKTNVNDSIFISFTNKTYTYLFNTKLIARPDVTAYFNKENIDSCGFNSQLFLNKLPVDNYDIGFVIKNKRIIAHSKTDNQIEIK
tara:strand:- start:9287 stop:12190 length:2904 start_codon:yes stop_codon:yes gene_type:complete